MDICYYAYLQQTQNKPRGDRYWMDHVLNGPCRCLVFRRIILVFHFLLWSSFR